MDLRTRRILWNSRKAKAGFALVTSLMLIVVIAVVVASFLSSMALERQTAHAFTNQAQAEFAAESAVALSVGTVKAHFQNHPDSATSWETVFDRKGIQATQATVICYRDHRDANGEPQPFDPPHDALFWQPFISGASAQAIDNKTASLSTPYPNRNYSDPDNSVDLNYARFPGDAAGWIGSPSGAGRQSFRVPWIEVTGLPTAKKGKAEVIARYAFWVEDESFKVNANLAGEAPRGAETTGSSPAEIPLQGLFQAANPAAVGSDRDASEAIALRNLMPGRRFFEFRELNRLNETPNLADACKFEGTIFSGALNLSRSGAQRLDLNAIVADSTDAVEIRKQLDEIITAINVQLPRFGQRFYRLDPSDLNGLQVSQTPDSGQFASHEEIYLQKIAANIRDDIDTDSQPTVVNNDIGRTVRTGRPSAGIEPLGGGADGYNSALAVGKENVPYLQEFACRATLNQFQPRFYSQPGATNANYDFYLDYYFEFWNMTPRDIRAADLGPNPFIKIYNQAGFYTGTNGTVIPAGRSFEIPLPLSAVFPAGAATVVTTDPNIDPLLVRNPAAAIVLPVQKDADRHYVGTTTGHVASTSGFRVYMDARNAVGGIATHGASDYQTRMLLGNDNGVIESMCALPIVRGVASADNALELENDNGSTIQNPAYFLRGGSLHGNQFLNHPPVPSEPGDPRTNNEQLFMRTYVPGSDPDQTRYFNSGLDNPDKNGVHVPGNSSFGSQNADYVDPTSWSDPFPWNPGGPDTPAIVSNAPMISIGELGRIFDPARLVPSFSQNIRFSRGGGRSLTVGQPDPLWDKSSASASREWTAWRLADIFCTGSDVQLEGRININGVQRDGGAALKAALYGYSFATSTSGDPHIAGNPLSAEAVDTLIAQIADRLNNAAPYFNKTAGPFAERGELSELPLFSNGAELAGISTAKLYDRGREEIFRRLVELVTTRGNVFSVYAEGQAIKQKPDGAKTVTATVRSKVTFELDPVWNPPLAPTFDPGNPVETKARFRPPDAYAVRILAASGG